MVRLRKSNLEVLTVYSDDANDAIEAMGKRVGVLIGRVKDLDEKVRNAGTVNTASDQFWARMRKVVREEVDAALEDVQRGR